MRNDMSVKGSTDGNSRARKRPERHQKASPAELVAARLIEVLLEAEPLGRWEKPWLGIDAPFNPVSGTRYRGINQLLLAMHPRVLETADPRFLTYRQAQEAGWQVRAGERAAARVFFAAPVVDQQTEDHTQAEAGDETTHRRFVRRAWTVFHASQVDGIPKHQRQQFSHEPHEEAETILRASGARIHHDGGNRAFYVPSTDSIHLPERSRFESQGAYYETSMHELAHWTGGGPARVPRRAGVGGGAFGSAAYAKEELRAEFAAAMVCAELGLVPVTGPELHDGELQHARYLSSWIAVLRDDPEEVFRAAGDARRISAFILDFSPALRATADGPGFGPAAASATNLSVEGP